jgi:hypothetical protein
MAIIKTNLYRIRCCEPCSNINAKHQITTDFEVTEAFYDILCTKPKYIKRDNGNAYIFGKIYDGTEYIYIGRHKNDVAQTGLIDITNMAKQDLEKIQCCYNIWLQIYKKYKLDWNEYQALEEVKMKISDKILFIGITLGGDVGANIFAHYNSNNEIDGLIIDNNCLFPG